VLEQSQKNIQLTMSYRSSNVTTNEIYKGPLTSTFFADLSAFIYICMYVLNTSVQSFKITRPNY